MEATHANPKNAQHQPSRRQRTHHPRRGFPLHGQRAGPLPEPCGRHRSYRDRNQQWQEETSYFDVVLWNKAAEQLAERLTKGTPVFITGRLQSRSWRDDQDQMQTAVAIQVRNLPGAGPPTTEEAEACQP